MQRKLIWMDQTLEEILKITGDAAIFPQIIAKLQELGAHGADIAFQYALQQELLNCGDFSLRCHVANLAEAQQALNFGFKRLAVRVRSRQNLSEVTRLQEIAVRKNSAIDVVITPESLREFPQLCQDLAKLGMVGKIILEDRESSLNPFETEKLMTCLKEQTFCIVEFHAHNGCGLATANVLGAMRAGVNNLALAIGGSGLGGHAALEEVLLAAFHHQLFPQTYTSELLTQCSCFLDWLGIGRSEGKAVLGEKIFQHESGIHVDGVCKRAELYEPFPPEEIGAIRQVVIGKHSGTRSLEHVLGQLGIVLTDDLAQRLLKKVRQTAQRQKGLLSDEALLELYEEVHFETSRLYLA